MYITIQVEIKENKLDIKLVSDIIFSWLVDNCTQEVIELQEFERFVLFSVSKSDAVELKITEIPGWITKYTNITYINGDTNGK